MNLFLVVVYVKKWCHNLNYTLKLNTTMLMMKVSKLLYIHYRYNLQGRQFTLCLSMCLTFILVLSLQILC